MAITRSSSSPSPVLKKKSKMGKKSLANKSKGKRPIIDDFDSDFEAPMPKRVKPTSSKKSKLNLEESSLPEISGKKFQKPVTHSADRTEVMCFVFVFGVFNHSSLVSFQFLNSLLLVWDCKFSPSDFYRSKCVCTSVYSFGHFLDMPEFVFHPQVVHSLLLREVLQPNPKEFWAKVAGRCIRFSAEEFYLISGLDCFGDCNNNTPDKEVSRFVLDIVDSGRWDEYCWGRESFELTIDSFKESFIFYSRDSNRSNTIVTKNPTLRDLKGKIFDLPLEKLKIKNMRPTDEERQQLQLDGLFLDESIDERGVVKQSFDGGSSSKKSDSADIDWMKSKLEMLSSNQSSLAEDFISLRCFVDFNFKSVMTVIKDIQEKVNAIHRRPSDEGKSSDELVTQDSDDDPDDDDDDDDAEDDDKQLPDPENIDSDSDDGGELVKVGGDADDADKAVTAVPSADVNPSEDVGGSDKNVKDVEKPKGDESRLKGDDFFDGLSQLVIDDDQVVLAGLEAVAKINVPAPNPDVVGEKSDAIHTDEETEDTVSDTPLLDKRKRAPALKSPFVDFGSVDVGSTPMELMSSCSRPLGMIGISKW
ncbi:uncharacterized protein LOC133038089 [Cannabis sativa]|uniref:uncharacterized protein LOC133038089 n=1 Tax=Cannabis sativa TaxID=3483 RepID=UPI0029CA1BC9|nr:uncharacterized protein LOC133038089 [Cannabis sativa]